MIKINNIHSVIFQYFLMIKEQVAFTVENFVTVNLGDPCVIAFEPLVLQ